MGDVRTSANAAFRDYVTSGVPASGDHEPVKSAIRATFGVVEDKIDAARAVADAAASGLNWTDPVRVRSTANVGIASALENGDTLNGVTLATGDRVFLGSQTAPAENGIYVVSASGAASRATDADTAAELARIAFMVREGDTGAGERWTLPLAAAAITLGVTALNFVQIGVEVDIAADVAALEAQVGAEQNLGWPEPIVSTGSTTPVDFGIIDQRPVAADGYLTEIEVGAGAAGSSTVIVVSMSGSTATLVRSQAVGLAAGVNVLPAAIPVEAGQYVGIVGGGYRFQSGDNPEGLLVWLVTGLPSESGTAVSSNSSHRYEVKFTIKSAMEGDLARLLNADLVPAERAFVDGERYFEPTGRSQINLYDGMRAALAEHIAQNDVLCFIGDSITHFAYAETAEQHFLNRITRFANLGIAADEPVMTALRSYSTYTPAFYGVTYTGSTSAGSRGPLNAADGPQSVVLADGAAMTFTGAYERIGVHYTREPGAGVLEFAYNGGAAFHTADADGTLAVDQLAIANTGQTASGAWTVKAIGGPVEITSLIREAVKASGSRPRLRTARIARGGYVFNNFGAAEFASILAIGSYAGGKCVPVIALGINDSFSVNPATIVTQATAMLDALEAGGVERIFAVTPMRPPAGGGSYSGGRTFDGMIGPLRKLYRERGVIVVPLDAADFAGQGLLPDGVHPGPDGNDKIAQMIVETIADLA